MKKIIRISVFVLIAIIAIVLIVVLYKNVFPIAYGKLYSGDHIRINLSIYYEGKQIDLDDIEVKCINPKNRFEEINQRDLGYSFKGGEYGRYTILLTIPGECIGEDKGETIIELQYLNANDWYISDTNCLIEINNESGNMKCNCQINTKYNDGTFSDYSDENEIEDGHVIFPWGI